MIRTGLVCLAALGVLAPPAQAFDNLERFASALPASLETPYLFDYAAPSTGFGMEGRGGHIPTDAYLARAIAEGASPDAATGIDFSAVKGVLVFGQPPAQVTVLFGDMGFVAQAVAALPPRGFESRQVEAFPVYWRGDDYAVSIATASEPDPLAAGLGKAQRLALGGDFLVRTAGWTEMEETLADLDRPTISGDAWRNLFVAVEGVSGENPTLELASGWAGTAFLATPDLSDPVAPAQKSKTKGPAAELLLFTTALFALTLSDDMAGLHIALPFVDTDVAGHAGSLIARRLEEFPGAPVAPSQHVANLNGQYFAVLTLPFPPAEVDDAHALYVAWMRAIQQRDFQPLMMAF